MNEANLIGINSSLIVNMVFENSKAEIDEFQKKTDEMAVALGRYLLDAYKFRSDNDIIKLNRYAWYGTSDGLPWPIGDNKKSFDSKYISIILPESTASLTIRGMNNNVLLTRHEMYDGTFPDYLVRYVDDAQLENIRVLDQRVIGGNNVFSGLEMIFQPGGFENLPLLADIHESDDLVKEEQLLSDMDQAKKYF